MKATTVNRARGHGRKRPLSAGRTRAAPARDGRELMTGDDCQDRQRRGQQNDQAGGQRHCQICSAPSRVHRRHHRGPSGPGAC